MKFPDMALVFLGAPPGSHRPVLDAHPGANTFPPTTHCWPRDRAFVGPSASRNTFSVSTITDGNARVGGRSTLSTLTLSRLRAEECDQPVTQSIATPEPSSRTIPNLDRALVARWSLECVATLGSRRS